MKLLGRQMVYNMMEHEVISDRAAAATVPTRARATKSLRATLRLPREHGAWAMLYVPFVAGALVASAVNWRVVLLLFSTSFLFIARESLLVWWRARRRRQPNPEVFKTLVLYTLLAGL